jgi:hypothetical protein
LVGGRRRLPLLLPGSEHRRRARRCHQYLSAAFGLSRALLWAEQFGVYCCWQSIVVCAAVYMVFVKLVKVATSHESTCNVAQGL